MKKYHHSPIFGVRSGRKSWMPYVLERNDHDPVRSQDIWRRVNKVPAMIPMEPIADFEVD